MEILSWVLFGFVVGLIARAVMPGKDPMGLVATTVLGIIGALLGGFIGQMMGFYQIGENVGFIAATLGAVLVLFSYNILVRRRAARLSPPRASEPEKKRAA